MRPLFLLVCCGVAAAQTIPDAHEKLIPTLWVQTSVEWRGAALQAYRAARISLDQALKNKKWTAALEQTGSYGKLPPAIILDIDETVLDNTPGQARQVVGKSGFVPADWDTWVAEAAAGEIPGAAEFCKYAASKKVTVFYISNREAKSEADTRRNLQKFGFPLSEGVDTVMLRGEKPEWAASEKSPRRKAVAEKYRVLLLVGDDFGDFLAGIRTTVEKRAEMAAPHAGRWGREWIVLPNPGYGSWEGALQEPERPATALEQLWKRESWLKTK